MTGHTGCVPGPALERQRQCHMTRLWVTECTVSALRASARASLPGAAKK
eukprot:gene15040-biopygen12689